MHCWNVTFPPGDPSSCRLELRASTRWRAPNLRFHNLKQLIKAAKLSKPFLDPLLSLLVKSEADLLALSLQQQAIKLTTNLTCLLPPSQNLTCKPSSCLAFSRSIE